MDNYFRTLSGCYLGVDNLSFSLCWLPLLTDRSLNEEISDWFLPDLLLDLESDITLFIYLA
jgi:hypothetical protein